MPDPLAFKALSYGAVGLLALTLLILSVVWLRIEIISGKPLSGFVPVLLIIAALCAHLAAYRLRPIPAGNLNYASLGESCIHF